MARRSFVTFTACVLALAPAAAGAAVSTEIATRPLGGGLTYVYSWQPFAVAPSVGLYRTWTEPSDRSGIAASFYLGLRTVGEGAALPFGARVELRRDLGSSSDRTILLSLELDLVIGLVSILGATGRLGP